MDVKRACRDGSFRIINVCPANGTYSDGGVIFDNNITIIKNDDSSYTIDGDAFTQNIEQIICDVNEDCDSDACYKPEDCFDPHCSGICGCNNDCDCSAPNVCAIDRTMLLGKNEQGDSIFAKACGCEVDTSRGCEDNIDTPWCIQSFGNGMCGCRDDDDCESESGKTCSKVSCIDDLVKFCATKEEHKRNEENDCGYLLFP